MNKITLFFCLLFMIIPMTSSFGAYQTELGDDIFIFVQTTVRNSDGTLIVYLESSKFSELDLPALHSFLDYESSLGNDPIITINGEKYQVIRRVQSQTFTSEDLVASTMLSDYVQEKPTILARFPHDGYTVEPGDTLESMWTFVRPFA